MRKAATKIAKELQAIVLKADPNGLREVEFRLARYCRNTRFDDITRKRSIAISLSNLDIQAILESTKYEVRYTLMIQRFASPVYSNNDRVEIFLSFVETFGFPKDIPGAELMFLSVQRTHELGLADENASEFMDHAGRLEKIVGAAGWLSA